MAVTKIGGRQIGDPNLAALVALVLAADKLPYATGVGALALTDLTAFARTLLAAGSAAAARSVLGAAGSAPSWTAWQTISLLTSVDTDVEITPSGDYADLRLNISGTPTATGMKEGAAGQHGMIRNVHASGVVTLAHQSTLSTAARRFLSVSGSAVVLNPGECALYWRDDKEDSNVGRNVVKKL